jgi:carbon monoxide dehydrogenase subunit G
MKVNGTATLNAPRDAVWVALNDPAVLVRTIPGCQQLEEVGPDAYRMTLTAGVASIKGTYTGDVALTDQEQPGAFTLRATGAGAPGTVQADVRVTLADAGDGTTRLDYDADAVVGGMIGGVGQRVLTGVAKKTAGEFFKAVDDVLTGKAPSVPTPRGETAHPVALPSGPPGVFTAPAPGPAVAGSEFLRGAVFGAFVALAGVLVGGLVARRRPDAGPTRA